MIAKIMNCFYHPTRPAVATCILCQKGLCSSCVHTEKDVNAYSPMSYCATCAGGVRSRVTHHDWGTSFFGGLLGAGLITIGVVFFGLSTTGVIIDIVGALIIAGALFTVI